MPREPLAERLHGHIDAFSQELLQLDGWLQLPPHLRPQVTVEAAAAQRRRFELWQHQLQHAAEELLQLARVVESGLSLPVALPAAPSPAVHAPPHPADADPPGLRHLLSGRPEQSVLEKIFARRKPNAFALLGAREAVHSWRELYLRVLALLAAHDPVTFQQLPQQPIFVTRAGQHDFAYRPDVLFSPLAVGPGMFAEGRRGAAQIVYRIGKLLDAFQIPRDSFAVFLAPAGR